MVAMETQNSIFEIDGRTVPYIDEGEGPVTLVLVPERGLDGDALGAIAHYLAEEAGFRILRVGTPVDSADAASDVVAVIDHVGIDDTWVGGHGAGGTVAAATALTLGDRANGVLFLGVEDAEAELVPALPILIVQGPDDAVTPPSNGEALQAAAAGRASIKTIDGGDHLFPMTHPLETAEVIEEYLDWD